MVMFVCNVCGASLRKNKVEEHYRYQCRNCDAVSCMDCGKDFWGDDYILHNKCISEQEKYKGVVSENKGEAKQEQWIANVNELISTYSGNPRVKSLLKNCVTCPNLPRKQHKFTNFVASTFREHDKGVVQMAWSIIDQASKLAISTPDEQKQAPTPLSQTLTENGHGTTGDVGHLEGDENEDPSENSGNVDSSLSKEENGVSEIGDEQESEDKTKSEEDSADKNGAESAKLKMKKQKLDRRKELASYQNQNTGKKFSKKQLKRMREDSISTDLAATSANEDTNGANSETTKKDKKHKKKDRLGAKDFPESAASDVIKENVEEEELSAGSVLEKAQLDDKVMKGVPKNVNIEADADDDDDTSVAVTGNRFNWHKAIKSALKAEDDLSLPVKKLRKKVLAEFASSSGDISKFKTEHEVWALFDKKLHSYPKAKISKDRVTLLK